MTELSRLESQYDAFLFASVCETDEMTLSVLSVLARQDVDPWQEAARLAQLSRDQAVNSLASKIWKSNSERWSPSEANILAVRLIELLPSHGVPRSNPLWTDDGNGRADVLGRRRDAIYVNRHIGKQHAKMTKDSSASTHSRRHECTEQCGDTIVPRYWNRLGHRRYSRNIDEQQNCCREDQTKTGIQFRGLG